MKLNDANLFAQIGYTDTVGSEVSYATGEGQVSAKSAIGIFDNWRGFLCCEPFGSEWSTGRIFGENSDSDNAIVCVGFAGLNAGFGVGNQPSTIPQTLTGGVSHSYGRFSGSNNDDEVVNTTYAYVGLTYWIGGGGLEENLQNHYQFGRPIVRYRLNPRQLTSELNRRESKKGRVRYPAFSHQFNCAYSSRLSATNRGSPPRRTSSSSDLRPASLASSMRASRSSIVSTFC